MPDRLGPNDLMPCGSDVARRRHLAKAEECDTCGTSPWTASVNSSQQPEEASSRSSCVPSIPQDDLFEQWREMGLIDPGDFVSLHQEVPSG